VERSGVAGQWKRGTCLCCARTANSRPGCGATRPFPRAPAARVLQGHRDWQLHCPSPCQLARTGSRRRLRVPFRVGACFPSTWRPSRRDVRRRTLDAPSGTGSLPSSGSGWLLRACSSPRRSRASCQCPLAVAREQSKKVGYMATPVRAGSMAGFEGPQEAPQLISKLRAKPLRVPGGR
jgi:hypothetical protein